MTDKETFLFSSESVGQGHPDKLCDQVSDAILDACLQKDPNCKVACEAATKTGFVMVFGEISIKSDAHVNYQTVIRDTIKAIGYDNSDKCFDGNSCGVLVAIEEQSKDIAGGVHEGKKQEDIGAGDQGIMMGYATDETEELMPLTCVLAHKLNEKMTECRRNGNLHWILPDTKTMVTVEYKYDNGACVPLRVHTVLISAHHTKDVTKDLQGPVKAEIFEKVLKMVIPAKYLDDKTIFHFNPSGVFEIGGPMGDAGLTGRKIIVDTYGGWGAHGGGAFSGKDATKVDRSASYCARWIAKSLVAAGLARRVLVQIAYAIGIAKPLAVYVDSYGTSEKSNDQLCAIIERNFDLRPGKIIEALDLKRPVYQQTACYGHFGRPDFTWEKPKKLIF